MLKTFVTLIRGGIAAAEAEVTDRSALLILDQQIRDAAAATERARRALALAIAQDEAEGRRHEATLSRIADLESRTREALVAGREDLATEAAEAIAVMEADRDAIREARDTFKREITQLGTAVSGATQRLADLERGRRIAQAAEAVRRLKTQGVRGSGVATLAEAETTLSRLRERQREDASAADALDNLRDTGAKSISSKLEAAGFGPRTRPTATDVLARLKQSQPQKPTTPAPTV
jgi:phage shock protein A